MKSSKAKPKRLPGVALPARGSAPRVRWTLDRLQKLINPILKCGSGAMLLAGTTLVREMEVSDLERLTNRCLEEERCRKFQKAQNDQAHTPRANEH